MSSEAKDSRAISDRDRYISKRREKRIRNAKNFGDLMMYIGCAGLMIPTIRKARENQNSLMGICATGAGAILSVGLGNAASRIFNKTVDKVVDFWDDVNPSTPYTPKKKEPEDEEHG